MDENKIKKCVIPVGGVGSRFRPATFKSPKELMPVIDPLTGDVCSVISLVVREAIQAGLEDITLIISPEKDSIEKHLKELCNVKNSDYSVYIPSNVRLNYVQQHAPLGLGHAVSCVEERMGSDPFALLLGDDFYSDLSGTEELLSLFNNLYDAQDGFMLVKFGGIIALEEVPDSKVSRYGILEFKDCVSKKFGRASRLLEKPDPSETDSRCAISGRYILNGAGLFDVLNLTKPGKNGEIQLTDALQVMLNDGYIFYGLITSGRRYDAGDKQSWANTIYNVSKDFNLINNE